MKAIKRTVAALLATLMLATSTSFTLAAETNAENAIVAKVQAAGIMQGTGNGFEPSKSLTRAEAAAIIVRMKGISEASAKAMAGQTLFKDVAASDWESGYVNQASQLGIVKGVSATEFAPKREVTVAEFVTMAVRALGAGTLVESGEGTWPANYVNFANEEGLLDEVTTHYSNVATRLDAATIVANTLEANMWIKKLATTNKEITYEKSNETILNNVLDIDWLKGIVISSIDKVDKEVTFGTYTDSKGTLTVEGTFSGAINGYTISDAVDFTTLNAGDEVDVWFKVKTKEIILVVAADKSAQTKVEFTGLSKALSGAKFKVEVNGKDKEYELHKNDSTSAIDAEVYYNGDKQADTTKLGTANPEFFGSMTVVNGKVTYVFIEEYKKMGVVGEITSKYIKYDNDYTYPSAGLSVGNIKLDDDYVYNVTRDGKVAKIEDIEVGDVYYFYTNAAGKEYTVCAFSNSETGVVKSVDTANYEVKIGSTTYDYDKNLAGMDLKDEVEVYFDAEGTIRAYTEIEGAAGDVAIVSYYKEYTDKYGRTNADVKLTYLDGTTSEELNVDVENSLHELFGGNFKENVTPGTNPGDPDVLDYKNDASTPLVKTYADVKTTGNLVLGKVVIYSLSGNKLTVKKLSANPEYLGLDTMNLTVAKSKIQVSNALSGATEGNTGWNLDDNNANETATLASDARIFVIKDSTKTGTVKVSEVSLENITKKTNGIKGYIASIDKTIVDYLIVDETTATAGAKLNKAVTKSVYAVGLTALDVYYDEDDDKDIKYDVVFSDGTRKDIYWVNGTSDSKITTLGTVLYKITLNDQVIVDVTPLAGTSSLTLAGTIDTKAVITSIDEDCIDDKYYLADDAIVVEKVTSSTGKVSYEVRELSDIAEKDVDIATGDKFDTITTIIKCDLDEDANTEDEVVFIMYEEATKA